MNRLALFLRRAVTDRAYFEFIILLAVLMVAVVTAMELENDDHKEIEGVIDFVALVIFILEATLKILAEGDDPLAYFRSSYRDIKTGAKQAGGRANFMNIFDFTIVLFGLATFILAGSKGDVLHDYASIKMLKLLRVLRLFSVAANVESLRLVMMGLLQGLKSAFYIVVLLVLIIYMSSVLAVKIFGANGQSAPVSPALPAPSPVSSFLL